VLENAADNVKEAGADALKDVETAIH